MASEAAAVTASLPRLAWRFVGDFARYSGRRGVLAVILVGLGAAAEGVSVLLLIPLLAVLTGHGGGKGWIGEMAKWALEPFAGHSRATTLAMLLAGFGVLMVLRSLVILARDVVLAELRVGFVETIRLNLSRRLAATDWGTVSRLSHARIVHLITTDVQRCSSGVYFVLQCGIAFVGVVVQAGLAFVLSPPLAAFSLTLLAGAAIALGPLMRRARRGGEAMTDGHLALMRDTTQFLGGLKQAFSHNREDAFIGQIQTALEGLRRAQVDFALQQTSARLGLAAISAAIGGVALWIGYGVLGLSAPVLMALLFVLARLGGPAGQIQLGAIQLANSLPAYEHIVALETELAAAARPAPSPARTAEPPRKAPVTFDAVSFMHGTDAAAARGGVEDLTFVIQPGDYIGVGGPSGAGKTTFADLLAGLYPPQSGRIIVGGQALTGDVARAWRDQIAYVPQDPFLFHDTLRSNLLWAAPDADEPAMWEALALTGADELARRMERGLDTLVGERGTLVSGGERQRLALARALLRRPGLLIMDEATSALDPRSEAAILQRLRAAFPATTIVMIAHRPESLAGCERRLTFERGRLAGDGPGIRKAGAA